MIKEALDLIRNMSVQANGPDVVGAPSCEPNHVYFLRDRRTGELARKEAEPKPRDYRLFTIEDAVEAVKHFGLEKAFVLCGHGGITAILDEHEGRRERLVMALPNSGEFDQLLRLKGRGPMNQKAFVSLLRVNLAGSVAADIVALFRDLKFSRSEDGESKISNSQETVGRKVKMDLAAGGKQVPDEIEVRTFVYGDLTHEDLRMTIKCAVDVNLDDATFTMTPLAGELESAQRNTDSWIKGYLVEALGDSAKVLCGAP